MSIIDLRRSRREQIRAQPASKGNSRAAIASAFREEKIFRAKGEYLPYPHTHMHTYAIAKFALIKKELYRVLRKNPSEECVVKMEKRAALFAIGFVAFATFAPR